MVSGRSLFARLPPLGIWGFSTALVLLLAGLAAFQLRTGYQRTLDTAQAGLTDTARVTEAQVRGSLRVVRLMLRAIAEAPHADHAVLRRFMSARSRVVPEIRQAFLINAEGKVIVSTLPPIEGRDASSRPFFLEARNLPPGRDFSVSKPLAVGQNGELVIMVSMPLFTDDGEFDGCVAVSLEIGYFLNILRSVHTDEPGAGALLLTPDGDILARDPEPEIYVGKNVAHSGGAFALHQQSGEIAGTYRHVAATDGQEKLSAARTMAEPALPPLVVIVGRPMDAVLAPWRSEALAMVSVVGGLAFAIFLLTGLAGRHFVALKASEERYRGLIETQNDLVVRIAPDEKFIFANEAFARTVGEAAPGVLGRSWREFVEEQDQEATAAAILRVLSPPAYRATVESRLKTVAGPRWIAWEGAAIRGVGGRSVEIQAVGRDITEWVENSQKQAALLRDLDTSNRELEQFAYVASHDLREPLRMITSYLGLLERRYAARLDQDGIDFLDFARDGARRMDLMVLDLLEFSRVGRVRDPLSPVPLADVMAIALRNLDIPIRESNAEITVPDNLPVVVGSAGELVRLFQNLLGNAIKYRHPERPLRLSVSVNRRDKAWECSVADNGIGIAQEYFQRIFDIFQRLHTRAEYDGTGIGLALCRKIVEHHGGRIWVESEPGQGSRFHFTLSDLPAPICAPASPPV